MRLVLNSYNDVVFSGRAKFLVLGGYEFTPRISSHFVG